MSNESFIKTIKYGLNCHVYLAELVNFEVLFQGVVQAKYGKLVVGAKLNFI